MRSGWIGLFATLAVFFHRSRGFRLLQFGFDDAYVRGGRHNAGHGESGGVEERPVLVCRAFFSARDGEHDHVDQLAEVRRIALRQHEFDDEELRVLFHCLAAVGEDSEARECRPSTR